MKLLFDQNISYKIVARLLDTFPNSRQVRDLGLVDCSDREIWSFAKENNFVIVTFDADFYDFSLVWGHPPKIIWIRSMDQTTSAVEILLKRNKSIVEDFVLNSDLACLEILAK
ncbi:MAG: DUF5615 family PIN-like protein [Luteibaculum sp.]